MSSCTRGHDRHGWRKCRSRSSTSCARDIQYILFINVRNNFRPVHHNMYIHRSCAPRQLFQTLHYLPLPCGRALAATTAMDGGSADIAGANICPYILYIAAPVHPCTRGIPYILYIKGCTAYLKFRTSSRRQPVAGFPSLLSMRPAPPAIHPPIP